MSHSLGAVRFPDKTIMFYEYDGTSDIVLPWLYKTAQEVRDNWRSKTRVWEHCKCERELEKVEIYTCYGFGFYLDGLACRHCERVSTIEDSSIIETNEVEVDWAVELEEFQDMKQFVKIYNEAKNV